MCIGAGELPVAERTSYCYFWISRVFALLNSFSDVNGDYSMRLFGNTFSLEVSSSSISNKRYRMDAYIICASLSPCWDYFFCCF